MWEVLCIQSLRVFFSYSIYDTKYATLEISVETISIHCVNFKTRSNAFKTLIALLRWNLQVCDVILKHFGCEFLHQERCCCLDALVYILEFAFSRLILHAIK